MREVEAHQAGNHIVQSDQLRVAVRSFQAKKNLSRFASSWTLMQSELWPAILTFWVMRLRR